ATITDTTIATSIIATATIAIATNGLSSSSNLSSGLVAGKNVEQLGGFVHGQAHDARETARQMLHEDAGLALYAVGTGLAHGLFGGAVGVNVLRSEFAELHLADAHARPSLLVGGKHHGGANLVALAG